MLGPCILLATEPLNPAATKIELTIRRNGDEYFSGATDLSQMARKFEDLAHWLYREDDFPHGSFLMTGTGIVPDDNMTLENGDIVSITVTGIGTLTNPVVKSG